jgi:NOL1/NOP2/sun family putative RNA methylase
MSAAFESYREFIPDFSSFQESLRRPPSLFLRANRLKIEPNGLAYLLEEKGVYLKKVSERYETLYLAPHLQAPGRLLEYFLGHIHPQALTSCLASIALSPNPNSYVLDMCASPGGKTSHVAELMNNSGLIIANELYRHRHIPLAYNLSRLGIINTAVTAYQAQQFPLRQRFDYVMADVPCSGEGTFRLDREGASYREDKGKNRLPQLQKRIILRAFDLLKENGQMIYSTCTYNPEENESVVDHLLKNRDARLLPINVEMLHEPGLCEWNKVDYDGQLRRAARFYPHQINSVGFFMARIDRSGGASSSVLLS